MAYPAMGVWRSVPFPFEDPESCYVMGLEMRFPNPNEKPLSLLKMPASQSRNFVFTLNNYTQEELELFAVDPPVAPVRYVIYGKEVAPSTGTPHLQGALCVSKVMTVTGVKKLPLMKRAHVEMMRGRLEDSEKYCSKESALISVGSRPKSQKEKGDSEKLRHHEINRLAKLGLFDEIEEIAPEVWRRDYKTLKVIAKDYLVAPTCY